MSRTSKALFAGLVFLFLYAPIGVLLVNSFNRSRYGYRWGGFSLGWYEKLLGNEALINAFTNSLTVAVLSATTACLLGTLMALALHRYRFRLRQAASGVVFVVLMSPDIVLAITFLVLFVAIGIQPGLLTLWLAHTTFCLPFVVITVYAQLRSLDEHLLDAARDLGASEQRVFRHIILPLLAPSVAASWLLAFTLSLDDVIVSSFVTGPQFEVLPIRVFSMVKVGVSPEVNVLAALLLLISVVCLAVFGWIMKRKPG